MDRSGMFQGLQGRRWWIVLLLGVLLRVVGLGSPPWDAHLIRQCDTANIARTMVREGIDPFHPRISWGGATGGTVESELPLYNSLVALGWTVTGTSGTSAWAWARGVSVLAWFAAAYLLAAWLRRAGRADPWGELLLFAAAPLAIRAGRNLQPDMLALALALAGLLLADPRRPTVRRAALAGGLFAIAIAVKGTLAFFLPALLWSWRRQQRALAISVVVAVGGAAAWYLHAHGLAVGGVSFGIWGASAGKWTVLEDWTDLGLWRQILGPALARTLPPVALLLAGAGLFAPRVREEGVVPVAGLGLTGGVALVILVTRGVAAHDYYLLPVVPFASVLCTDGLRMLRRAAGDGLLRVRVVLGAVVVGSLLTTAWMLARGGLSWLRLDLRTPRIAAAITPQLPEGPGVVIDEHGSCLAFALDRPGWRRERPDAADLQALVKQGAAWVVLTSHVPGGTLPSSMVEVARGPGGSLLVPR